MQLDFACPQCGESARCEVTDSVNSLQCPRCGWSRHVSETDLQTDGPVRCFVCGCYDLWRQKDFPPRLGLAVVGLGALLSTIAWSFYWIKTAIGILMVFAIADLMLYSLMRDVLVCYRCGARHRRVNPDEDSPRFDLELAERYRQEAKRLKNSATHGT